MKKLKLTKDQQETWRYLKPLAIYGVFYLIWFKLLEIFVKDYTVLHTALDDRIPFCEYFVIPYFLWFVYVPGVLIYLLLKNKRDYMKCAWFLCGGMSICLLICTLFPNGTDLRPLFIVKDNPFAWIAAWLQTIDTPTNVLPSIHVYNSLGAHFALINNETLRAKKGLPALSFLLCMSVIASTMFLKQHSVIDVIAGCILAVSADMLVYHSQVFSVQRRRRPLLSRNI